MLEPKRSPIADQSGPARTSNAKCRCTKISIVSMLALTFLHVPYLAVKKKKRVKFDFNNIFSLGHTPSHEKKKNHHICVIARIKLKTAQASVVTRFSQLTGSEGKCAVTSLSTNRSPCRPQVLKTEKRGQA